MTEELFAFYILHRPAVYDNVPKCGMYKYQTDFIYDVSFLSQVFYIQHFLVVCYVWCVLSFRELIFTQRNVFVFTVLFI